MAEHHKFTVREINDMKAQIPAMCDQVIELGRNGASAKMICLKMNLSSAEINSLRDASPQFDAAVTKSMDLSQGYHEAQMLAGMADKSLNSQLYANFMRGAFSGDYESASYKAAEKKVVSTQTETINFSAEVDSLIRQLREAG